MLFKKIIEEIIGKSIADWNIKSAKEIDGWDSVCRVRLIVETEKILDRDLSDAELEGLELIEYLQDVLKDAK